MTGAPGRQFFRRPIAITQLLTAALLAAALWPVTGAHAAPTASRHHASSLRPRLAMVRAIQGGLGVAPPQHPFSKGSVRQSLFSRYVLRTASRQLASIGFADGSVLHLNQNTDATLVSPQLTQVKGGEVDQIIRPGTNHQVATASATASATGTNFDTACAENTCFFSVMEGAVLVSARVGSGAGANTVSVVVTTGQYVSVVTGQAPSAPTPMTVDPTAAWISQLPPPSPPLPVNLGLAGNGGHVVAASSTRGKAWSASHVDDGDVLSGWQSAEGKTGGESVTLALAGDQTYNVSGVVVDPAATSGEPASDAVKTFEIDTSTDGKTFHSVLSSATTSTSGLQIFNLPSAVRARFVRYVGLSNWGGSDGIALAELEVVGQPEPSSAHHNTGNPLGLTGGWTYFPDTRSLVVQIGAFPQSGVTGNISAVTVNGLPSAGTVTYTSNGNFSIAAHIPRVDMRPLRPFYLPNRQSFGFQASPVPPGALPAGAVLTATVHTSAGPIKLALHQSPRQGEWTLSGGALSVSMQPATLNDVSTGANSLVLPVVRAGSLQDGIGSSTHGVQTPSAYTVSYSGGVPGYDNLSLHLTGGAMPPAYDLAYLTGGSSLQPVILRQAHGYGDVAGDRVTSNVTYTVARSSHGCFSHMMEGAESTQTQVLTFGPGVISVSQPGALNASGTISRSGRATLSGRQGTLAATWTARLNADGAGDGVETLSGSGCTSTSRFTVAPAPVDTSATGALTPTGHGVLLESPAHATRTLTFVNHSHAPAAVALVRIGGDPSAFRITGGTCARGATVPIGASCTVTIDYQPHASFGASGTVAVQTAFGGPAGSAITLLTGAPPKGPNDVGTAVRTLLTTINRDRALRGLQPLRLNPRESACSLGNSRYMARLGRLTHAGFPHDVCVPSSVKAENVASSQARPLTAAALQMHGSMIAEGPCASNPCTPAEFYRHSHYEQLMDPRFTTIGIGLCVQGTRAWLTEDLYRP